MKSVTFVFSSLSCLALSTASLRAHHGQDFILVEDYEVPQPAMGILFANFEWMRTDGGDEFGVEPGLLVGIFPRVAAGIQGRFDGGDGEQWDFASVAPSLHVQLTPPDVDFPFKLGISAAYEFADEASHDEHGDEHGHEHEHEEDAHGAEEAHSHTHQSSAAHAHGTDHFEGRLIVEKQIGQTKFVFNLAGVIEDDGDAEFGYGAGVRQHLSTHWMMGIEGIGDFDRHGYHELVLGTYFEPLHGLTLKAGIGLGLTDESPDYTFHAGVVWHF
jgi:hypothetical protein